MPNINIKIRNKVAKGEYAVIVCDNSDYTAVFDFDAEWDEYTTKTARFVYGGKYTDVVFSGNECPVPVMQDTRAVTVGVFAGDLHTTTPAYFACVPSILFGNGIPADPTPDVYNQLMELLNKESGIWYPAVDDAGNMSWTRSMSETEPQPVNIKGPKGDAGADGIGIPGADGKDGVDGKSAYELAQDNGFVGTMQEWLASLVGADGANGVDGKDGISPAVSVAAITGGNRITITDAEGAKTFDVMDGAQGASGADGKDYVLTDADKQEIAEAAAGFVDVPSVQPDWNQNDTTAADYVKNRPFYENALVSVQYPGAPGAAWYKVSDSVPTGDHSVGASCTTSLSIGGEKKTGPIEICEDDYYLSVDANVIVILKDNVTISGVGITFPKKGTYFLRSDRGFISGFALGADADPEITWDGNTSEIKTLDEKFIPDVSGLIVKSSTPDSTKKFRITVDDSGTISATEVS